MAVTLVQFKAGTSSGSSSSATATFTSNTTSGNTIVVGVYAQVTTGTLSISTVSDTQSNTYTKNIGGGSVVGTHYSNVYTEFAYATSITGGATTVTVNASTTAAGIQLVIYELTASSFDQAATPVTNSNTAVPGPISITTANDGSYGIVIGTLDNGFGFGSGWFTAGGSWTLGLESGGGNQNSVSEHQAQTTHGVLTSSISSGFSGTTGPNVASMITFAPTGGGGGGGTTNHFLSSLGVGS